MEMEDQLTPTQIKIIAGWSHNYPGVKHIWSIKMIIIAIKIMLFAKASGIIIGF
jgi:hypothetical protein